METIDAARIPEEVHEVLRRLEAAGFATYLVGGCVRDLVDGRIPKDFDVATSALAAEVGDIFTRTLPTGLKHGTVTVLMGKYPVEVTTFRSEGIYHDHRRPSEVAFHDEIERDLERRDFTCNAMAWSRREGLIDRFDGRKDMEKGILRTVGDPCIRFHEDALRMLRAVRFCCTFGFHPVDDLLKACSAHHALLGHVSVERIAGECTRIFEAPYPARLRSFDGTGLFETAFERILLANDGITFPPFGDFLASTLEGFGPSTEAGYAAILLERMSFPLPLDDLYPMMKMLLMKGHRLSSKTSANSAAMGFVAASIHAMILLPPDPASVRRVAARLADASGWNGEEARRSLGEGTRLLEAMMGAGWSQGDVQKAGSPSLHVLRSCVETIVHEAHPVTENELSLTGAALIESGLGQGPSLGRIRRRLLEQVLDDPTMNTTEALWSLVRGMV